MSRDAQQLEQALGSHCYRIAAGQREQLQNALGLSTDELLRALVGYIKPRARCPISGFYVGAAGLTAEEEVFLGVNLEFSEASLSQTVHAEQFLLSWSRASSASPLVTVAVSAPPCGHCRQFLREFDHHGSLRILIGDEPPVQIGALLPRAFTPLDLEVTEPFLAAPLRFDGLTDLEQAARAASASSYTPYSGSRAALAVRARDGRIFAGSALENAAFNPSLPPFQAALVACHAYGVEPSELDAAVLCQRESPISYAEQSRSLAQSLGMAAESFQVVAP